MQISTTSSDTIAVLTGKSLEHIFEDGGSQSWVLDKRHAKDCRYLVCCRSGVDWVEGPELRGSAFLIGRISNVVPATNEKRDNRWLIKIREFARVDIPGVWQRWRNPVRYTNLTTLGIDLDNLNFEPMPESALVVVPPIKRSSPDTAPLTINEAKRGLAKTFGVPENAIEITIRG
jgi:hypothetical protein